MTAATATAPLLLPLRLALRDLRGGLRGFYVFIACIALGVMAIAGVDSFSRGLVAGLAGQGQAILGGDVAFALIQREANDEELAFLRSQGEVSTVATLRAMVRTADGRSLLVELKGVDDAYPLYGGVTTQPEQSLKQALAQTLGKSGQTFGALAEPSLLSRLDLAPGAALTLGSAPLTLAAALAGEPDKLAGGIGFGPRLMVSLDALRASALLQPGSLVRWHYRVRLPAPAGDDAVARLVAAAKERLPDAGWDVRTRAAASPQLERNVERFTQYLTLVGLAALMIGGVGVANAIKHHLDRRRDIIATLKSVGATSGSILAVYFTQVLLVAGVGVVIGLILGIALPYGVAVLIGPSLPLPFVAGIHVGTIVLAAAFGFLTAAAFALWPLGRAHDVPASALFRDEVVSERALPRKRYVAAGVLAAAALAIMAIAAAHDRRVAVIFVVAAGAVLLALRLVAWAVMAIARRAPRPRSTMLRLALANIHRPGALTPTVLLSLGLGVAVLVTVLEIDFNLRRQFTAALPQRAPSYFFLDIPAAEAGHLADLVRAQSPSASFESVPMLRGRIVEAGGRKADEIAPREDARWVLQSDRGITYTGVVPEGSRVVEGEWWGEDYQGPPLLSFEKKLAEGLGIGIGDNVTVNVLGRNITARISNLRTVDWQSLGINFVLVFSPGSFAGAPVTHIATVTYPNGGGGPEETALVKAIGRDLPGVAMVGVKEALDTVGALVVNLVLAIRGASAVTLLAAVLVLGGALAAGHRHRVYDAVILKTLGATRRKLLAAYALEYLMLGVAAALFGVAAGSLAAWRIVAGVMTLPFAWMAAPALVAALAAVLVTLVFGLVGTFAALGRKPAPVLRNL
ncbi:FtsX-like permease family protein [Xanthobacteraceae bacterium Astr-EGSB]|uniref:ABC transporter permease n=1 Tax=Astrobacterium formosum TaxID=3069710 RepID=UPI0027B5F129|nr:FtsX-like permease family protein [Xanthobacteraceae bacterium Astr-EGSB]